jgi:hypothetical protein
MSIKLVSTGGGSVTIQEPNTASDFTLSVPAQTANILTNKTAGTVLQVVSVNNKAQTSTTGDSWIASTLAASITPTSSTSKILVIGHYYYRTSASGVAVAATVYRNSTSLTSGTIGLSYNYAASTAVEMTAPFTILDSPATTSSTTYTLYFRRSDNAGTAYIGNGNMDSVITLMEIAA